ncbi:hypothetical protein [Thermodesulfovibrio thiophilus]|uniref:hypothetical protein n=1 Tax=Thermodesulfovibrio thiophilus TaxID=340095 RepID=UPI0004217D78|nr:hypothetical protein [Thermodesulfovibrio thiophilus]
MERFINRAVTAFLIILIGVILGYGWRMLHEDKNYKSWRQTEMLRENKQEQNWQCTIPYNGKNKKHNRGGIKWQQC